MNEFVSWCRHLLVPFLFSDVTSLHPLHFIEMIFPLVPLFFHFGAKPHKKCDVFCWVPTRTRTGERPLHVYIHVQANGVVLASRGGPRCKGRAG